MGSGNFGVGRGANTRFGKHKNETHEIEKTFFRNGIEHRGYSLDSPLLQNKIIFRRKGKRSFTKNANNIFVNI